MHILFCSHTALQHQDCGVINWLPRWHSLWQSSFALQQPWPSAGLPAKHQHAAWIDWLHLMCRQETSRLGRLCIHEEAGLQELCAACSALGGRPARKAKSSTC